MARVVNLAISAYSLRDRDYSLKKVSPISTSMDATRKEKDTVVLGPDLPHSNQPESFRSYLEQASKEMDESRRV